MCLSLRKPWQLNNSAGGASRWCTVWMSPSFAMKCQLWAANCSWTDGASDGRDVCVEPAGCKLIISCHQNTGKEIYQLMTNCSANQICNWSDYEESISQFANVQSALSWKEQSLYVVGTETGSTKSLHSETRQAVLIRVASVNISHQWAAKDRCYCK